MGRRSGWLLGPLVVLGMAMAPTAHAATVELLGPFCAPCNGAQLHFTAAPGEANRLTVTANPDRSVTVRDAGAAITGAPGCVPADAREVRCRNVDPALGPIEQVFVELGDRDDHATIIAPASAHWRSLIVAGGRGHDVIDAGKAVRVVLSPGPTGDVRLLGGAGRDTLIGSPVRDELIGGAGADRLFGRGGNDDLDGDFSARRGPADRLDGGRGRDTADYSARQTPVHVDLAHRGVAGARGEHDRLVSVESVTGGDAHDVLAGNGKANVLAGNDFRQSRHTRGDTLIGRGGADHLFDFNGRSTLDGGRGDDRITGAGRAAALACGPGDDLLDELGAGVLVPGDCERLQDRWRVFRYLGVLAGRARFRERVLGAGADSCQVTLTLRLRGHVLGRDRGHGDRVASLALGRAGRRAAARDTLVGVRAAEGCGGFSQTWRMRLQRPGPR